MIVNSVGAVVLKHLPASGKQETIDIAGLPAGMYIVRVQTDRGSYQSKLHIRK
jgi:hypothetical protein